MDITFNREDTKQLRALGVEAVYLFGSRAVGRETPRSDFDFAVLMAKTGHRRGDEVYDKLYDLLSPHCPRTLDNDVIDIVFLRDAPLELQMHIIRYGRVLYDAAPRSRANFEARTTLLYADYRPLLDIFDDAILQRYATH